MRHAAWTRGREAEVLPAARLWPWQGWRWRRLRADHRLGRLGEALAERALRRRGYRVVARNLRRHAGEALPNGEIDLVAIEGGEMVFLEVKTRARRDIRYPAEAAVDAQKRHHLERFARRFAGRFPGLGFPSGRIRYDVVVIYEPESPHVEILLYRDVFPTCLNFAKTPSPAAG